MPPPTDEQIAARRAWAVDSLRRRITILEGLVAGAGEPLDWLGVQRQARAFRGYADGAPRARLSDELRAAFEDHVAAVRAVEDRAAAALSALDPEVLAEARSRLGLRLALIGKGGAGKTVLSSTLARTLARRGRKVFAADLDTNPGLAFSLGIPVTEAGLPPEALEEQPAAPYGWQLSGAYTPDEAVERFAAPGPDGIRVLGLGKIGGVDTAAGRPTIDTAAGRPTIDTAAGRPSIDKHQARRSVAAVRQILRGYGAPDVDMIADLEAGPTTPFEGYHDFSTDVVVVVGPAWRSGMTARRLLPMVGDRRTTIVGNRFRDEPDHPGLTPAIRIPFDPDLAQAEREGKSPFDACPDSPAVAAVGRLADLLLERSAAPVP